MGDIPVSSVVNVTIGVSPTFPTRAGFGTLNIVGPSDVIGVLERARVYSSIIGVGADFPLNSEEYKAAQVYYSQRPSPSQLIISRRVAAPIGAQIRGGANAETTLALYQAITTGSIKLTLGAVVLDVVGVNFSAANTLAGVAAILQTAVRAQGTGAAFTSATVQYKDARFYVTSGVTGATSTISPASAAATGVDVSAMLALTTATNARVSQGYDTETLVQALEAAQDANQDWYGATVTAELRDNDAQIMAAAAWIQARVKVFGYDSNDRENLDPLNEGSTAYKLDAGSFDRTIGVMNEDAGGYGAVSALARAFTVNFNVANSTLTLKFKQLPTITPLDCTTSQKNALDKIHLNAYISVGGNNMLAEGVVFGGRFFDEIHGIDWLQNAIETNVFGKLYTDTTKTAMTDSGAATLQQKVEQALDTAVLNGLCAPGYLTDGTYLQKGYVTSVVAMKNHNQSDKERRQGPPITFTCIGAGAIHGIAIVGNFQR